MGFESCHPAVNFLFFAAALYGAVRFDHPVFLAIAYVSAFAYSVRRCGKRAVAVNLFFIPLILIFGLYYSSYHHFGVTVAVAEALIAVGSDADEKETEEAVVANMQDCRGSCRKW